MQTRMDVVMLLLSYAITHVEIQISIGIIPLKVNFVIPRKHKLMQGITKFVALSVVYINCRRWNMLIQPSQREGMKNLKKETFMTLCGNTSMPLNWQAAIHLLPDAQHTSGAVLPCPA